MSDAPRSPSKVEQVDIAVSEKLKPALDTAPGKAAGAIGKVADEPPLLALSAAVLAIGLLSGRSRLRRTGVRMLAAHAVAIGFKNLVKNRVDRTRPQQLDRGRYQLERGTSKSPQLRSFPSGHAAGAVAVARAVAREYPVGRAATMIATALSGLQVVRRAHFPSDAVAGGALGALAELIANRALRPLLGSPVTDRAG